MNKPHLYDDTDKPHLTDDSPQDTGVKTNIRDDNILEESKNAFEDEKVLLLADRAILDGRSEIYLLQQLASSWCCSRSYLRLCM